MVKSIIEGVPRTRFDRAHFKEYGDFSLNFEVVYYVLEPDYNIYMDIQQEINLSLFSTFEREKIAFAYPTREIIVRPNNHPSLSSRPVSPSIGASDHPDADPRT
jgi:small-conductance mechanosensitive channel